MVRSSVTLALLSLGDADAVPGLETRYSRRFASLDKNGTQLDPETVCRQIYEETRSRYTELAPALGGLLPRKGRTPFAVGGRWVTTERCRLATSVTSILPRRYGSCWTAEIMSLWRKRLYIFKNGFSRSRLL